MKCDISMCVQHLHGVDEMKPACVLMEPDHRGAPPHRSASGSLTPSSLIITKKKNEHCAAAAAALIVFNQSMIEVLLSKYIFTFPQIININFVTFVTLIIVC